MRTLIAVPLLLASLVVGALAEDRPDLGKLADAVRATDAERTYKKIPWLTDVVKGLDLARQEHRPVFLYMILGDPLEDC